MAEVEGDWKEFSFRMATPDDYPSILEHLRNNFYLDEPMSRYIGQGNEKNNDMDRVALAFLQQGISFSAYHKETGKLAGVRVMGISHKEENPEDMLQILESPEAKDWLPNILEIHKEANIYEKFGIDHYGDFLFVSVDREFRNQGLGTEIYNRAIRLLQSKNVPAADSLFTSPYSQKIARKMGFVEFSRRKFKDYVRLDGSSLLPEANDDEVTIVMAKKL